MPHPSARLRAGALADQLVVAPQRSVEQQQAGAVETPAEPGRDGGATRQVVEGRAGRLLRHPQADGVLRSEEHTSELQSLMRNSYAVFCLKKKKKQNNRE